RSLFFNTPARLRFLRGPSAEASRVTQLLRRYALGHPEVALRLLVDGKEQLFSPGTGGLTNAVAAVYGWRTVEALLPVGAEEEPLRVAGLISLPVLSRTTRADMNLFVNGRWLQPRSALFAIQEAYSSLLMVDRFPIVVLSVSVPPDQLDVNVHPAKSEVRFADERRVTSLIGRTVRSALLTESEHSSSALAQPELRQFTFTSAPATEHVSPNELHSPIAATSLEPLGGVQSTSPRTTLPPLRILGQMAATYIIAEGPDGMCLIDQHAAHERVVLERLQAHVGGGRPESQALLEPVLVPLSAPQAARVEAVLEELAPLGFVAEPFGGDALLVRDVPAALQAERVSEVIVAIEEGLEGLQSAEARQRAMLATLACHSAVRAGQVLDMREMRSLIADLEQTRVPTACAHGRPTILELSRAELEREFGRRGSI
ncbi:MAG: DNA mismatch repair protein MutL, partial [Chloroflexota bacterium]|nr:DNA mismatch repair protein MutL [Chloroflexota bacterium]